jgi:hypothetical protein
MKNSLAEIKFFRHKTRDYFVFIVYLDRSRQELSNHIIFSYNGQWKMILKIKKKIPVPQRQTHQLAGAEYTNAAEIFNRTVLYVGASNDDIIFKGH